MESLLEELKKKLLKWHHLFFDQDEEKGNPLLKKSTKLSSEGKLYEYDKDGSYNSEYLKKIQKRATLYQSEKT